MAVNQFVLRTFGDGEVMVVQREVLLHVSRATSPGNHMKLGLFDSRRIEIEVNGALLLLVCPRPEWLGQIGAARRKRLYCARVPEFRSQPKMRSETPCFRV